jgi:invasion protein IalB
MRRLCIAIVSLSVLALAPTAADAQSDKKAAPAEARAADTSSNDAKNVELPTQGWLVNCAKAADGMTCRATQSIGSADGKQLLAGVAIFKMTGTTGFGISLQLPHGLFLPAGASVQVDTEPAQTMVVETCDHRGCFAGGVIGDKVLAAMRKGKVLAITFQNLTKNNVKVQLPLSGFPDALAKL